jgi:hypothetical protein
MSSTFNPLPPYGLCGAEDSATTSSLNPEKQQQGITNTLALPIDKILYIVSML